MQPSGNLQPAVFLDRDGVVNQSIIRDHKPLSPKSLKDLVVIDGVKEAIALLHEHGFTTVVITNQPDVARGNLTSEMLAEMHRSIARQTGLQYFYICIHDDKDRCECRKPNAGLITKAAKDLNLDIANSFLIGDRWKDIEAGQRAGCQCFFIDNSYSEQRPTPPFHKVTSLLEAAVFITGGKNAT